MSGAKHIVAALLGMVALNAGAGEGTQILNADELPGVWTVTRTAEPMAPDRLAAKQVSGCVTLGYVIEADGSVRDFRLLAGDTTIRSALASRLAEEAFAESAAQAVGAWKFEPVAKPAKATFTSSTVTFGNGAGLKCAPVNLHASMIGSEIRGATLLGSRDELVSARQSRYTTDPAISGQHNHPLRPVQ